MINYLIQSFCCLALLYLVYWVLLRNSRAYQLNRFVLLAAVVFSLSVPALELRFNQPTVLGGIEAEAILEVLTFEQIEPSEAEVVLPVTEKPFNLWSLIRLTYLLVGSILLLRFLFNLFVLFLKRNRSERANYEGTDLNLIESPIGPFTFLGSIFLNKADYLS
ncbi:MAG: hypothetical protein AAF705_09345, partial [Bacteroidota bacterium]